MRVSFNTHNTPYQNECFFLDDIEEYIEDSLPSFFTKDLMEACLTHFGFEDFNTNQYIDEVHDLLETVANADFHPWTVPMEPLPLTSVTPPIPSLESLTKAWVEANAR